MRFEPGKNQIQLAYAIGIEKPVSIVIECFGTKSQCMECLSLVSGTITKMSVSPETINVIKLINEKMVPYLDEKQKRLFGDAEAEAICHGGITAVREISGASRSTISSGMLELNQSGDLENSSSDNRIRKKGAGRM